MIINFHFFRLEIIVSRAKLTRREIREEVLRTKREIGHINAIKRYRELVDPHPSLQDAKKFVDALPE